MTDNSLPEPKIAVMGAGAIGSLVGGILAHHGAHVTLVAKRAHVEAINRRGLSVDGAAGTFQADLKAVETLDFSPDLVFVTVKNPDVETTCQQIKPHLGHTPVVMMQNGIASAERAATIFSKNQIISCILLLNAQFLQPGRVTYVKRSPIILGSPFGAPHAALDTLKTLLSDVAPTHISRDIQGDQWAKLFVNALGNGLDGMTGMSLGQHMQHPVIPQIGVLILKEALRVVQAAGIALGSLPGLPMGYMKFMIRQPMPLATFLLKLTVRAKGDKEIKTSTLQSLLKWQKTEIDYLNGEIVRLGRRIATPTPVNSKVVELIHRIEETHQFLNPDALRQEFAFAL